MSLFERIIHGSDVRIANKALSTNSLTNAQAIVPRSQSARESDLTTTLSNKIYSIDLEMNLSNGSQYSTSESSKAEPSWLDEFNSKLEKMEGKCHIYKIKKPSQLADLLDYHSDPELNKLPTNMFPYLHGLNTLKQRYFFKRDVDISKDTFVSYRDLYSSDIKDPVQAPKTNYFSLMVVKVDTDSGEELLNSIYLGDLLQSAPARFDDSVKDIDDLYDHYEKFSSINDLDMDADQPIDIRNYKSQIKLMAPLSHFVVYSSTNDFQFCSQAATLLNLLMDEEKNIYMVDFNMDQMGQIYIEHDDAEAYPIDLVRDMPFSCKLLKWEQNLIWKLNSLKWCYKNVCLGTIADYNFLHKNKNDFKLFFNCHEDAAFPSLHVLQQLLYDAKKNGIKKPIYLDFPSSGSIDINKITYEQILSFLNTLCFLNFVTNSMNEKVFLFSYDGFTGISLFVIALGMFLNNELVEKAIISLLGDHPSGLGKNVRLYYFRGDLILLKRLEGFMKFAKDKSSKNSATFIKSIEYTRDILPFEEKIRSEGKPLYDWFDFDSDCNFPSKVFGNLYLGSLSHASSSTILNTLNISKIIAIGERPNWFEKLKVSFDFESRPKFRVIEPIFIFNDGTSKVYEIHLPRGTKVHNLQSLKTIIYIYHLNDDGRDSMLPLLTSCPEHIQLKFLVDPRSKQFKTMVHCRIGVSRSASLIIAAVMKYYKLNLLQAYLFVRVKRFNVIIQPNLRLFYELYLYEEYLKLRRVYNWSFMCNEIHKLNDHYIERS
ncbi:uncharacterized protein PRCAT00004167001 [Priceomyces carsonii]|uniref:uncharacterized protein n=1 Tax=Priceomyces carsonii TaxID=28549 RepID=UPI002ED86E7E|nr:unnamed protein product [Priceomyces carsonii]